MRLFGGLRPSFHVMGISGWIIATIFGAVFGPYVGIPVWTSIVVAGVSALTFFGLAALENIILGKENLVYYHQMFAYFFSVSVVLLIAGLPYLPGMDVYVLCYGVFNVFGRIGCFLVGCCLGKPHRHGVCYGHQFRGTGFDHHYIGISVLPVQLVESGLTLVAVVVGTVLMLSGNAPGTAAVAYLVSYAAFRFVLEQFRGDRGRPTLGGFSEAQWTGFLIAVALGGAGLLDWLPLRTYALATAGGMLLLGILILLSRNGQPEVQRHLAHPEHLHELIDYARQSLLLNRALPTHSGVRKIVNCTSWGLQVSADVVRDQDRDVPHYSISMADPPLSMAAAEAIARALGQMRHPGMHWQVVEGGQAVYHVLYKEK